MRFVFIQSAENKGIEIMRSLKEQYVFDPSGGIVRYKIEWVWEIVATGRELGHSTIVDRYIRAISKERVNNGIGQVMLNLLGGYTYKYELNNEKLAALIGESQQHIDQDPAYLRLRWHDCVVLLCIIEMFSTEAPIFKWAGSHLGRIMRKNTEMKPLLKSLQTDHWSG